MLCLTYLLIKEGEDNNIYYVGSYGKLVQSVDNLVISDMFCFYSSGHCEATTSRAMETDSLLQENGQTRWCSCHQCAHLVGFLKCPFWVIFKITH
jgi:hypothetical protein